MPTKSEIKYIQSLSHKKFRQEEGCFVVEGVKMVQELLVNFSQHIHKIYALKEWSDVNSAIIPGSVSIELVEEFQLNKLSQLQTPPEVIAIVKIPENNIKKYQPKGITLVLDQLQDPGNLGTIIRTCDWFGISNIVCSENAVDAFNSKVVQSSMGSIMRVNIFYENLNDFFNQYPSIPIYAAVLNGKSIYEVSWQLPSFVIIGNESNGISDVLLQLNVQKISIPQYGKAESLNAAVASAIILSNALK